MYSQPACMHASRIVEGLQSSQAKLINSGAFEKSCGWEVIFHTKMVQTLFKYEIH